MEVKILKPTNINGKSAETGETIEVSDKEARLLILTRKAESTEVKEELSLNIGISTKDIEVVKEEFEAKNAEIATLTEQLEQCKSESQEEIGDKNKEIATLKEQLEQCKSANEPAVKAKTQKAK